jgi:hypothetical protein
METLFLPPAAVLGLRLLTPASTSAAMETLFLPPAAVLGLRMLGLLPGPPSVKMTAAARLWSSPPVLAALADMGRIPDPGSMTLALFASFFPGDRDAGAAPSSTSTSAVGDAGDEGRSCLRSARLDVRRLCSFSCSERASEARGRGS